MADNTPAQRGILLDAIAANYPHRVLPRALDHVATLYGDDQRAMTRDFAWLAEEGLIESSTETIAGVKVCSYRATSKGVEVAAGRQKIAGVAI